MMRQKSTGYTEALTRFAAGVRYEDIPQKTVEKTKVLLLDTIGVMVGAYESGPWRAMRSLTSELGGKEECTIIGSGTKTDVLNAALVNGTLGHDMELDDYHTPSSCHIAAVVIPAILTAAERFGSLGRKIIEAVNVAYDVEGRIGRALRPFVTFERAFHNTSVCGHFGAAAGVAKLLDLDPTHFAWALGHAGSQASGMNHWQNESDHYVKSLQTAVPARSGVFSALLAAREFPSSPDILEGNYNIFDAFSGYYDFDKLTDCLGERWEVDLTGLKYYGNCFYTHGPVQLFTELLQDNHIKPEEIKSVVVKLCSLGTSCVNNNELITHNCQYLLAASAYGANMLRKQTVAGRMTTPEVKSLASKITVVADPEIDKLFPVTPTIVEIAANDGRSVSQRLEYPKGDAHAPLTKQEVEEKFLSCAGGLLGKEKSGRIMDLIWDLEQMKDAHQLLDLLFRF